MAARSDVDLKRQLDDAFEKFRDTLQDLLELEARRSVDGTIRNLKTSGPFTVESATVEVVIRDIKLASPASNAPAARSTTRPSQKSLTSGRRGGRPPGGLRTALLMHFGPPGQERATSEIHQLLQEHGVEATSANLHQQLRRLVDAGEFERSGRGRYRRSSPRSQK